MMKIPKPGGGAIGFFNSVLPDDPKVKVRPMFGNNAAFVNGNLFMGLFGDDLFLRLSDEDRKEVEALGGTAFEPMAGRPMKGYVVVPRGWREDSKTVRTWAARSLRWVGKLPPKASAKGIKK